VGAWRWHDLVGVGGEDMFDQQAFLWFARHNDLESEGALAHVEAELGFAAIIIRPVAKQAILGEDRADIAIKAEGWTRVAGKSPPRAQGQSQEQNQEPVSEAQHAYLQTIKMPRLFRFNNELFWRPPR
jgi:hypothetical protein